MKITTDEKHIPEPGISEFTSGAIIQHKGSGEGYVVTANYGGHAIAVKTMHVSNPSEWAIVAGSPIREIPAPSAMKNSGQVPCPKCGKVGWMHGECPCAAFPEVGATVRLIKDGNAPSGAKKGMEATVLEVKPTGFATSNPTGRSEKWVFQNRDIGKILEVVSLPAPPIPEGFPPVPETPGFRKNPKGWGWVSDVDIHFICYFPNDREWGEPSFSRCLGRKDLFYVHLVPEEPTGEEDPNIPEVTNDEEPAASYPPPENEWPEMPVGLYEREPMKGQGAPGNTYYSLIGGPEGLLWQKTEVARDHEYEWSGTVVFRAVPAPVAVNESLPDGWLPMESAPLDGTVIELLSEVPTKGHFVDRTGHPGGGPDFRHVFVDEEMGFPLETPRGWRPIAEEDPAESAARDALDSAVDSIVLRAARHALEFVEEYHKNGIPLDVPTGVAGMTASPIERVRSALEFIGTTKANGLEPAEPRYRELGEGDDILKEIYNTCAFDPESMPLDSLKALPGVITGMVDAAFRARRLVTEPGEDTVSIGTIAEALKRTASDLQYFIERCESGTARSRTTQQRYRETMDHIAPTLAAIEALTGKGGDK